jgi:hypothetical protein
MRKVGLKVLGFGPSSPSFSSSSEMYSYSYSSSDVNSQSISVKFMVWEGMDGRAATQSESDGEEAMVKWRYGWSC